MSDSELDSEHRVWKRHMKMVLSNERTLISWTRVGATYGSGALVAATLASGQTERVTATELAAGYTLTVQALLGLVIVTWATWQFARRGRLLAARWHGSYENNVGPVLFAVAAAVSKPRPGLYGRPAQTKRLMGRGSPTLGVACGMIWRRQGPPESQLAAEGSASLFSTYYTGGQHPEPSAHDECLAPAHPRLLRRGLPPPAGPQPHGERGAAVLLPYFPRLR